MEGQNAKNQVSLMMAQRGIIGNEIEKEVDKIIAAIPEATRSTYPEDRYEACLAFMKVYYAQNDNSSDIPNQQQNTGASEAAPSTMSAAQAKALLQLMANEQAAREEKTAKTTIKKILIDKPAPSTYLDPNTTIIPTCKPEKLDEYEKALVQTEENKQAFATLKAAVQNSTPVPIYVNKSADKVMGYVITTPSSEAGNDSMEQKTLPVSNMLTFVATQLRGYIPTVGDSLGVKLQWREPKKTQQATDQRKTGAPYLKLYNKQAALASEDGHEIISVIEKDGNKVVTMDGKLRTAMSFKIDSGRVDSHKQPIYRTIRLTGNAQVPKFVRKTDEYTHLFGSATKSRNDFSMPSVDEQATLDKAMANTLNYLISNNFRGAELDSFKAQYENLMKSTPDADEGLEV